MKKKRPKKLIKKHKKMAKKSKKNGKKYGKKSPKKLKKAVGGAHLQVLRGSGWWREIEMVIFLEQRGWSALSHCKSMDYGCG